MDREVLTVGDTVAIHMTVSSAEPARYVQAGLGTPWKLIPSPELLEQESETPHLWNSGFVLGKASVIWRGELAANESLSFVARFLVSQCGQDTVCASCYDPREPMEAAINSLIKIPVCVKGMPTTPTKEGRYTPRRRPEGDVSKEMTIDGKRMTVTAPDYYPPPPRAELKGLLYDPETGRTRPLQEQQEQERDDGCCESAPIQLAPRTTRE